MSENEAPKGKGGLNAPVTAKNGCLTLLLLIVGAVLVAKMLPGKKEEAPAPAVAKSTPTPSHTPSFDHISLEQEFLAFLKQGEFFDSKKGIEIKPDFKPGRYDATISFPMEQIDKIAHTQRQLKQVGKEVTGVLAIALVRFAQQQGFSMKIPPYSSASAFMFVRLTGITGKKTSSLVGYSSYNPYSDSIDYTSKLKKVEE